ncbi:MAG: GAF domain-containing protein [Candidatus Scalindua sp.]|jgi:HD-GYP domain-containing protein (c-di-GMP phosphodiesterase class II)|nr:GAF domain-containing protein [Candidatus Scalindua sp.]MBT6563130.1 GAF domain-containing protein [Candidatus Scalindua sp.]MBT7590502.1 GAF domain-containing protein [Candidatus Scalindua sp.]
MLTITDDKKISKEDKDCLKSSEIEIDNTYLRNIGRREAIGVALTSIFEHEKLYKMIISLTTHLAKAKNVSLMVIEEDSLRLKYSNHLPSEIMEQCAVKVGTGISGLVASKKASLLVKDIESSTRYIKKNNKRYSSNSFISTPLIINERVVGVINVSDKHNDELFNESDLNMLKVISKYSAIAIRNLTLINKTKKLTLVKQLNRDYYDKAVKYLPVTLKSLRIGPFNKSEIYLKNSNNGKDNYVLYWNGENRLFVNEKRDEFIRKNINKLYVPKNGRKQYLRFMETNLERVVDDEHTCLEEKLEVIKHVAINIFSDINATPAETSNIERSKQWIDSVMELINSAGNNYSDLIYAKKHDQYLCGHSIDITLSGLAFANHLGMNIEELNEFGLGLFLQDIGMQKVDPLIFNKPTKLNNDELDVIKKHSEIGFHILQASGKVSAESCLLALLHHENYNGSGYPYGLNEKDINYYGRISRIVDVFNALTTDRPYANAMTTYEACETMKENMNGVFDPKIFNKFVGFLKSFAVIKK